MRHGATLKEVYAKAMASLTGLNGPSEAEFFERLEKDVNAVKEYNRARGKRDRSKNLNAVRESLRRSYAKNAEQRRIDAKKNRAKLKADPIAHAAHVERVRIRRAKRRASDPGYRMQVALRTRMWMALHRHMGTKACKSLELLGCSLAEFRRHIESLWTPGMSWDNYGHRGWHVDHKKPIAAFDLRDHAQQRECFHFTNLQPLWWMDNLSKGDR